VKIQPTLFAQEIAQNLIGQQQFAVVGGFFLGFGCRRRGDDRQPAGKSISIMPRAMTGRANLWP